MCCFLPELKLEVFFSLFCVGVELFDKGVLQRYGVKVSTIMHC